MPKAIAVQAVFLIGVIAIFLFFIVGIFWGWIDITKFSTSDATCRAARIGCCSQLVNDLGECNWDSACSEFGINQPTLEECCDLPEYKGLTTICR